MTPKTRCRSSILTCSAAICSEEAYTVTEVVPPAIVSLLPVRNRYWPGRAMMADEVQVTKPSALIVTWYGTPGFRSSKAKDPLSPDTVDRLSPGAELSRMTLAPGTMSSFTSVTVPLIVPGWGSGAAICCPIAGITIQAANKKAHRNRQLFQNG